MSYEADLAELTAEEYAADLAAERAYAATCHEQGWADEEAAMAEVIEAAWHRDRADTETLSLAEALTADAPELPADITAWQITGDSTATWALRKLAAERSEIDRIDAAADAEIARIKTWAEDAKRTPERAASFFESKLIDYRRRLEANNPKLPKTYKLPAGSIAVRKGSTSVKVTDRDAFVSWALDNCPEALSYSPLVSALSDFQRTDEGELLIPGTGVADPESGEIDPGSQDAIPGVSVVVGDPSYKVTPNVDVDPF